MKKIFVSLLFVFSFSLCEAQYVTLPDSNFVKWLKNNGYSSCISGNKLDTTCNKILSGLLSTNLTIQDNSIISVFGIQYFKNLQYLTVQDTKIESLPALPVKIVRLTCSSNQLVNILAIPNGVTYFDCSLNKLNALPFLPNGLKFLVCYANNLTSLPSLPSSIGIVYCQTNHITALPTLPVGLKTLISNTNPLFQLPMLPDSLLYLDCSSDSLTYLPTLTDNLKTLLCYNNSLTVLPKLPASLHYLDCSTNFLTQLPDLPLNIDSVYANVNLISALPAIPFSLNVLYCEFNQITSIPNLPNTPMSLDFNNNNLTSLPQLPDSLYGLQVSYNPNLKCLPQLNKIKYFFFDHTSVGCVPDYGNIFVSDPNIITLPLCSTSNPDNCTSISTETINLSINGLSGVSVYPNPTSDYVNINLSKNDKYTIELFDILGRIITNDIENEELAKLDLRQLPAGIYNLSIKSSTKVKLIKLVKQ